MSNIKTTIDEWEVKDLEDNSTIGVYVAHNTEMAINPCPACRCMHGENS